MKNLFAVLMIVGLLFCTISCGKSDEEKALDAYKDALSDISDTLDSDSYADAVDSITDAAQNAADALEGLGY